MSTVITVLDGAVLTAAQQTALLEYEQNLTCEVPTCRISHVYKHDDQAMAIYLDYQEATESSTRACELAVEVADRHGLVITTNVVHY